MTFLNFLNDMQCLISLKMEIAMSRLPFLILGEHDRGCAALYFCRY